MDCLLLLLEQSVFVTTVCQDDILPLRVSINDSTNWGWGNILGKIPFRKHRMPERCIIRLCPVANVMLQKVLDDTSGVFLSVMHLSGGSQGSHWLLGMYMPVTSLTCMSLCLTFLNRTGHEGTNSDCTPPPSTPLFHNNEYDLLWPLCTCCFTTTVAFSSILSLFDVTPDHLIPSNRSFFPQPRSEQ